MMICRMAIPNDLAGVLCSGRLRRRTSLGDMLGDCWIGWYSVVCTHGEALLSVAIIEHVLRSMVKSKAENDMEAEFLMTSNGGLSLCDDEELAW
jgi:hypothetical protein